MDQCMPWHNHNRAGPALTRVVEHGEPGDGHIAPVALLLVAQHLHHGVVGQAVQGVVVGDLRGGGGKRRDSLSGGKGWARAETPARGAQVLSRKSLAAMPSQALAPAHQNELGDLLGGQVAWGGVGGALARGRLAVGGALVRGGLHQRACSRGQEGN